QQRTHLGNAFQHYKKALRYDPENRAVPLALASVLNDAHRGEEAEKVILEWEAKYRPTIETCDLGARSAYMRDGEPDYLAFARFLTRAAVISPSLENQVNASLAQRIGAITGPALRAEILRIHRSLIDNSVRPQDRAMFLGQWIPAAGAEGQG